MTLATRHVCAAFGSRRAVLLLLLSLAAAISLGLRPVAADASSVDQATAYQLDPAHDGYQTGGSMTLPLSQAWSDALGGAISYPLVVNGVVYVTAVSGSTSKTTLYAIRQSQGGTPLWSQSLGGSYDWSGLTYDAGQVFTVNTSGTMSAWNAQTGELNWQIALPGQSSFSSPPTAYDGVVYVGGAGDGGTVYAVSEGSGTVLWTQSVENGDDSSPAVDADGVYVTYACGQDYDFSPLSGTLIWHHTSGCEGGSGTTPVLANGTIFGRDSSDGDLILSAADGTSDGSFTSTTAPAVGGGDAYMLSSGAVTAVSDSGQGTSSWTSTGTSGDGTIDTAPLIADGYVFAGSSTGELYAFDPSDGDIDWSGSLGASTDIPGPDEQNVSQPLTGLGAGGNTILVPAGSTLYAYDGANVGTGTPANTLAPSVSGTPEAGQAVGADVGLWTALPDSYSYQWYLCDGSGDNCQEISGATSEAYVPSAAEIGDTLMVDVGAENGSGTASAVMSAASVQVIPGPPAVETDPSIGGTAAVGDQLTAAPGTWSSNPTSYAYQWLQCSSSSSCTAISGATQSTFDVTSAQAGYMLEVEVVASNSTGPSVVAKSPQTAVVPVAITMTLTSSANPATAGTQVVFRTLLSSVVNGGSITFSVDGQPIQGCDAIALTTDYIGATCTIPSIGEGTWTVTASYSGYGSYGSSSVSMSEVVKAATTGGTTSTGTTSGTSSKTPAPPSVSVGVNEPKNKPNFRLTLTAVRTSTAPYKYWFALKGVRCLYRASAVAVTVKGGTMYDKCGAQIELATTSLPVHHYYALVLQAVRLNAKRKVTSRGHAYHVRLYMPGSEVQWTPITGVTLPMTRRLARVAY